MTENSTGKMSDPLLGDITVFREYKPQLDAIEYTIFFKIDDKKYRIDFRLKTEASAIFGTNPLQFEGYVRARVHERYERGEYVEVRHHNRKSFIV